MKSRNRLKNTLRKILVNTTQEEKIKNVPWERFNYFPPVGLEPTTSRLTVMRAAPASYG